MSMVRVALVGACAVLSGACGDPPSDEMPWTTSQATTAATVEPSTSSSDDTRGTSSSSTSTDGPATLPDLGELDTTGGIDCTAPDPAPDWLLPQLQDHVARLSGEAELGGTTLVDRATVMRRALVATWLEEQLVAMGLATSRHEYGTGTNILATIPATEASQGTLVLGAHYDSVAGSPGANDNASGVAVILAAARYVDSLPCRTHDVIVVAFDEEEIGLVGSAAFASKLVADRTPVVSVHTIDQLGWDADGDRVLEIERPDAGLYEFYDDVADDVPELGGLTMTDTGFTDHVSFRDAGFLAVGLSEEYVSGDTTPHYHQPGDRYDTVEFGFTATAATLVHHAFAHALAP